MSVEKTEAEIIAWFEKDLLPKVVAEGRLPVPNTNSEDLTVKSIKYEESEGRGTDHFASLPYFAHLVLEDRNNPSRSQEFRLVVKFINQKVAVRQAMETDVQFYNEMIFYNEVTEVFQNFLKNRPNISPDFLNEICPVCRYAHIDLTAAEYGIVIMDDLRVDGFTCAKSKAELDLDHCFLAVEKLGKLHALSYALKLEKPEELPRLAKLFKECRYQDGDRYKEESMGSFLEANSMRGIDYLLSKDDSPVPKSYLKMLAEKIESGLYKKMTEFIKPKEPLSVICHGDFCRNNILYKFENGKPIDCKLFDYQTWRYSSPSVDLSFFIYMNTTQELREAHFDDIISCYVSNVTDTVAKISNRPLAEIKKLYPVESFKEDFGELSLYGYAISSFFLPMMMVPKENAVDFEDEWETKTQDQMTEESVKHGGEVASIRVAEIIVHMYKEKYYS